MRLLHIIATPRGPESNTLRVSNVLLEELYLKYSDLSVKVLELFKADLPAVAGKNIESKYKLMTGQQLEGEYKSSWAQIEANIKQFLDTDIYLITTPMWNFGIPYALKYYIDAIIQPGYLYRYNEQGIPEGLVIGKKMICVTSRGGDYSADSLLHSLDFVEPYLRTIFNFVGITDIHFINAQPMDISLATRRTAILNSIEEAREIVRSNNLFALEPVESVEFLEGVKPAPLQE
jgi:FMN-dependent NADH-azoreductase